jgi:hypothetical protein
MKEEVKIFHLLRHVDATGTSGTGVVAIGCQLPSGTCIIEWTSYHSSLGIYRNVNDIEALHGHGGNTEIIWGLPDNVTVTPNTVKSKRKDKKKKDEASQT